MSTDLDIHSGHYTDWEGVTRPVVWIAGDDFTPADARDLAQQINDAADDAEREDDE